VPDPRDDFAVLEAREHMMFGFRDPYGVIRAETEARFAPDAVESIVLDAPKWLTIARRDEPDGDSGTIVQFGFCARAQIAVNAGYSVEQVAATLTFLVGGWDDPPNHRRRVHFDLHDEADAGYDDARFRARFLAFRDDEP
jgi:hypothetical protein